MFVTRMLKRHPAVIQYVYSISIWLIIWVSSSGRHKWCLLPQQEHPKWNITIFSGWRHHYRPSWKSRLRIVNLICLWKGFFSRHLRFSSHPKINSSSYDLAIFCSIARIANARILPFISLQQCRFIEVKVSNYCRLPFSRVAQFSTFNSGSFVINYTS